MLFQHDVALLKGSKNLLAFSAGADSTALFFLLLEHKIAFDIAIVNYNTRLHSKEEVAYAQELAFTYEKSCHLCNARPITSNFEFAARKIRYDFFETLIAEHGYDNLLTAHHLGDRLEWFFMQFTKGAGCAEINSFTRKTQKEHYTLLRPLLHVEKNELIHYLRSNKHTWYEDASNQDIQIKRNEFRHLYTNPLLQKYKEGIVKSFEYMDADLHVLLEDVAIFYEKEFYFFKRTQNIANDIYHIDKLLKKFGILISAAVREELQKQEETVVSRRYVVAKTTKHILIAPYLTNIIMDKQFKEHCRSLQIPPKLRPYLFLHQELFSTLSIFSQDVK
jgi:tRNA(Ile)-lysidine synthase